MHKGLIVLVTEDRYVNPAHISPYIAQILEDDAILSDALAPYGYTVRRVSWSDPDFDWSTPRCLVFRTMWDYFHRFAEFTQWLNRIDTLTTCVNNIDMIRWNMDKHYLADLQRKGVQIVDTTFVEQGSSSSLQSLMASHACTEAIIKPAVSGAARNTYRIHQQNAQEMEALFTALVQAESMLFQPFQKHILTDGEVSCMLMGGKYTHAVLKKAKAGDFRVQDDFGGTVHDHTPTAEEIAFCEKAVSACTTLPAYARVDFTRDNRGQLALMELELIEPELWFRRSADSAQVFAQHLHTLIS